MINKIALSGLPGVGKDTVKYLLHKSKLKCYFYDLAFADHIKYIAARVLEYNIHTDSSNLYGESKLRNEIILNFSKNDNITFRDLLNDLGELFRKYHPDYWINRVFEEIETKKFWRDNSFFIITDLRRINEYQRLKEEGFFLIRIKRPNTEIPTKECLTELNSFEDNKFDYVINNDGNEYDLEKKVEELVEFLLKN